MSTPSHLDWCGDADCGDVSHEHAAAAARGRDLRRHADAVMMNERPDAVRASEVLAHADVASALLSNLADLIDVPKRPAPHGCDITRLERIEAVLRANRMHEATCAYLVASSDVRDVECDCWLADSPA